jgi:conjugal transfer mating pair stabilization protein TraN
LLEEGTGDLPGEKRSYCQFDSKLAQIVQEQAVTDSCILVSVAPAVRTAGDHGGRTQGINFNQLDFANFMEDLMNNQKSRITELTEKTKQIKELLTQSSSK